MFQLTILPLSMGRRFIPILQSYIRRPDTTRPEWLFHSASELRWGLPGEEEDGVGIADGVVTTTST
jgi:hypothetical protein